MKTIICLFLLFSTVTGINAQSSIYSFSIDSLGNTEQINFSDFQGKVILIVNTASKDSLNTQLSYLEDLNNLYRDSGLIIIGMPSDDFDNEPLSDEEVGVLYKNSYAVSFCLSTKINVSGESICPVYKWLTKASENGVINTDIKNDFQKFLIGRDGKLTGIFDSEVSPLDASLVEAIQVDLY